MKEIIKKACWSYVALYTLHGRFTVSLERDLIPPCVCVCLCVCVCVCVCVRVRHGFMLLRCRSVSFHFRSQLR
jgi:hypothetical protein